MTSVPPPKFGGTGQLAYINAKGNPNIGAGAVKEYIGVLSPDHSGYIPNSGLSNPFDRITGPVWAGGGGQVVKGDDSDAINLATAMVNSVGGRNGANGQPNANFSRDVVKKVLTNASSTSTDVNNVAKVVTKSGLDSGTVQAVLNQYAQANSTHSLGSLVTSDGKYLFPKGFGDNSEQISLAETTINNALRAQGKPTLSRDQIKAIGNCLNDALDGASSGHAENGVWVSNNSGGKKIDLGQSWLSDANIKAILANGHGANATDLINALGAIGAPGSVSNPAKYGATIKV
jgi:hypothetical protein